MIAYLSSVVRITSSHVILTLPVRLAGPSGPVFFRTYPSGLIKFRYLDQVFDFRLLGIRGI
jgi:hypothetical protein